jgi:hypothetical protein
MTLKAIMSALGLTAALAAHAATPLLLTSSEADVGDADSFGRNTVYLGLAKIPSLYLAADCANIPNVPVLSPEERCTVLNPQPAGTSFNQANLKTIRLPANASRSLLCLSIRPDFSVYFENYTGSAQDSDLWVRADILIQNEILNDPTLINPSTGLPFAGRLLKRQNIISESRKYDPGEESAATVTSGRDCDGGLISKSDLRSRGLSEAQATAFFAQPMTLSFGISGRVALLENAQLFYVARLYGDQ